MSIIEIKKKYICDCCSANFTVEFLNINRTYTVKRCPVCGNEYLAERDI
jgi:DNA-directed RNA polymerase subunit RPC12/RpoP